MCKCVRKRKPNERAQIRETTEAGVEKDVPSVWQLKALQRNSRVNWFKMMTVRKSYS